MNHGSLFSGIGGFDLAAQWMGWENIFHCEIDEFCNNILKYYWPKAKNYYDIKKTSFTPHKGTIDIVSGGFPCQPYSVAGKRKGKDDDRHLWPENIRAIREIQPRWYVGENVPGLINWSKGMVFEEVQTSLEDSGFEVFPPLILPASSLQAPHQRDRLWIVAFNRSNKKNGIITNTNESGLERNVQTEQQRFERKNEKHSGSSYNRIFSASKRWEAFPTESPLYNGNDGLSDRLDNITFSKWRKETIRTGGNAIVPPLAYEIFKIIEEFEKHV